MTDDPLDDQVGYKRPPRKHQFQPGISGNPKGRRKGARGFKTVVQEILRETVPVTVGGRRRKISKMQAALEKLVQRAVVDGDMRALERMLHYAEQYDREPAAQEVELEPEDAKIIADRFARARTENDDVG